ncbi:hypothetical protein ACLOJK_018949, partial [Asimina triloba]
MRFKPATPGPTIKVQRDGRQSAASCGSFDPADCQIKQLNQTQIVPTATSKSRPPSSSQMQYPFQAVKLKSIGNSSKKLGTNPVDPAEQLKSEANQATVGPRLSSNSTILAKSASPAFPKSRQMRQRTHPNSHSSSVSTSNGVCVLVKHGETAARLSSPTHKLQHILTVE